MSSEPQIIQENSDYQLPFSLSDDEISYLEGLCFNPNEKRKNIEIFYKNRLETPRIRIGPYAGIIDIDGSKRLHFSTKVRTSLFYMLSYLRNEDEFYYDPDRIIEIKEGANFFDIIAKFYFNYLNEIVKKGLLKKYIRKRERLRYLKGKILIREQLRSNLVDKTRLTCEYFYLTYDNLENRIVMSALNALIPMIQYNASLRRDLRSLETLLKEHVPIVQINPQECDLVKFNRINEYYKGIIGLSRIILEERFIRSVLKGSSKGFNFIVNMNQVYEDFVSQMVEEVVETVYSSQGLKVEMQSRFTNLVKEKTIVLRPDVIIRDNNNGFPLILDTKYKRAPNNADYYQVIAYSLALKSKACCLIYPKNEVELEGPFTLYRDPTSNNSDVTKMYTKSVDLEVGGDEINYNEYIGNVQNQIKVILSDIFSEVSQ